MAGLSVVTSPSYANTFAAPAANPGAVPGVAQASQTFSGQLQGSGQLNNASIGVQAPASAPQSRTVAAVPAFQNGPVVAVKPAAPAAPPALAPLPQTDLFYNGTHYTDQHEYQKAVINDVNQVHADSVGKIQSAYKQGLISFDQQQKLIDQSRANLQAQTAQALQSLDLSNKAAQDSQQAHFASADANAVSSRQGELAKQTQDQYAQGVASAQTAADQAGSGLDSSFQNLQQARGNFEDQYQNNLKAADQAQVQGTDAANNAGISYQNQIDSVRAANAASAASANAASAPQTVQYDPQALTQQAAQYVLSSAAIAPTGQNLSDTVNNSFANLAGTFANLGIDPNSGRGKQILAGLQQEFNDPTSSLYANFKDAFTKKSLQSAAPAAVGG